MILRRIAFMAAALTLSLAALAGPIDSSWPPERFQQDYTGTLDLSFATDMVPSCGTAPPGYHYLACTATDDSAIALPNACQPEYRGEQYAKIVCHEMAHLNGWSGEHER